MATHLYVGDSELHKELMLQELLIDRPNKTQHNDKKRRGVGLAAQTRLLQD